MNSKIFVKFSKIQYHIVDVYIHRIGPNDFLRRQIFRFCTALYCGVLPTVAVMPRRSETGQKDRARDLVYVRSNEPTLAGEHSSCKLR